jgi:hypothetical protein
VLNREIEPVHMATDSVAALVLLAIAAGHNMN